MNRPWVVKVGGALLDDADARPALWDAFRTIARSRPLVVVHGGGASVDRLLDALGRTAARVDGLRVTSDEDMPIVAGVLGGEVNASLVTEMRACGVPALGLRLYDAGLECERLTVPDLGRVGRVIGGADATLFTLIGAGFIPVVASIGADSDGLLNVNADDAAIGVALALHAAGLALLTDVPGVLDANGSLIPEIGTAAVESLITDGVVTGGMAPKVRAAASAAEQLGAPAVVASWREPAALVALIESADAGGTPDEPHGTTFVPNRNAPATELESTASRRPS